jgi:hypothetical protein
MNSNKGILAYRVALAGGALSLLACTAAEDVANLGNYYGQAAQEDAGAAATESDAPCTGPSHDAGSVSAAADSGAGPFGDAPACLVTGCVTGRASPQPDPAVHCHPLVVTAGQPPPLPPGSSSDRFVGFTVAAPVQGKQYLRSISPIIDNAVFLHHMKLYESKRAPVDAAQTPPPRRLLYSWAPGEPELILHPSVGVEVPGDTDYTLEVHYVGIDAAFDGSGFQVCFTPTEPEHLVSISSLDAKGPPEGPATGTCTPEPQRPIVLLSVQPASTVLGTRTKLTLRRQGGAEETLFNELYDHEVVPYRALGAPLEPGDTLSVHCESTPPVTAFFPATCTMNVLHWPAHSLVSGSTQANALESCSQ